MTVRQVEVPAFAKINLGLRVLYKRPDGYHELRTVFQTISLADQLGIQWEPAETTSIQIDGTPHIPDNLVEKAARLVLDHLGVSGRLYFDLRKTIPAGAGLGGGSTDAGAVLLALPVLLGYSLPLPELNRLAAQAGSDVPFFLYGGTTLGLGRGEELYPLPDREEEFGLLVAPGIHSSTAEAYRDLSANLTSNSLQNKLGSFQQEVWQGEMPVDGNDFESVVFARHPELREIRDRLLGMGARTAAMSGSGSSIFAFFRTAEEVDMARRAFRQETAGPLAMIQSSLFNFYLVNRTRYRNQWMLALQHHIRGNEWPPRSLYAQ